jgi:hypothetical protein
MKEDKLYGNHKVYSPSGVLMFLANNKRIDWYLQKDLINIKKIEKDGTLHVEFKFEPKGNGHGGKDDYYLAIKENRCVVTGERDLSLLTKHHVIPYMYRKHFPLEFKDRSSHDIVLMTKNEHSKYERFADEFKIEIEKKYGVYDSYNEMKREYDNYKKAASYANVIIKHREKIPLDRLKFLYTEILKMTDVKPTSRNLRLLVREDDRIFKKEIKRGRFVVDNIDDFHDFCIMWREHFIKHAEPKYMPKGWSVDREPAVRK